MDALTVKAFAKINLSLDVLGTLPNGYHEVKMVMQTVSVFDLVTVTKTRSGIELSTNLPYLPIDPTDVGRVYEADVIRINSQSGKGGIGYLLEHNYGYVLPSKMREDVGYTVKGYSDRSHKELSPDEVKDIFYKEYVNIESPITVVDYHFVRKPDGMKAIITIDTADGHIDIAAKGNGHLDAVSNAFKKYLGISYSNLTYTEHALSTGSTSQAVTYVSVTFSDGKVSWGAGVHDDIIAASINALVSAINRNLNTK